jgi:mRNA interferase MazF
VLPPVRRSPDAGDVLWIDYGEPVGHEQAGRRPSLVLTGRDYNERSSIVIACPISRAPGSWPFKVEIPPVGRIRGFVLLDQIRAVDPAARFSMHAGRVSEETLALVRERLAALLGLSLGSPVK